MEAKINLDTAIIEDIDRSYVSISVQKVNTIFYAEINSIDEDGDILTHAEMEIPIEEALYLAHSIIKMTELDKGEVFNGKTT